LIDQRITHGPACAVRGCTRPADIRDGSNVVCATHYLGKEPVPVEDREKVREALQKHASRASRAGLELAAVEAAIALEYGEPDRARRVLDAVFSQ
jgi:hypothetical protein